LNETIKEISMKLPFLGDIVGIQLNLKDPEMFSATWSDGTPLPEVLCEDLWGRYEDEIRAASLWESFKTEA
jgi:hypothetical protein